tara:strand:+ start:2318 stop:3307 length:990 start_codon:yes stop_codon:yes gene_type:complete
MNSLCNTQGKEFKYNKFKFLELSNNKNIIEGMHHGTEESDNSLKITELEAKFNGKLQQYGIMYDEYIKEKLVVDIDISHLLDKTVKYNDIEYYISRKGIMRKLSYGYANHSCLAPLKTLTEKQKQKLKLGEPLKKFISSGGIFYEKCTDSYIDKTGIIISNRITNEVAWLDDLGVKHQFRQGDMRNASCPNGIEETVSSIQYSMVKSGDSLGPKDICDRQTLTKQGALNKLNSELIGIAVEMKTLINSISVETQDEEVAILQNSKSLDEIITSLNSDRNKIQKLKKEIFSLEGNVIDNKYLVDASNMQYIGWGVSLITMLVLALYTIKK